MDYIDLDEVELTNWRNLNDVYLCDIEMGSFFDIIQNMPQLTRISVGTIHCRDPEVPSDLDLGGSKLEELRVSNIWDEGPFFSVSHFVKLIAPLNFLQKVSVIGYPSIYNIIGMVECLYLEDGRTLKNLVVKY